MVSPTPSSAFAVIAAERENSLYSEEIDLRLGKRDQINSRSKRAFPVLLMAKQHRIRAEFRQLPEIFLKQLEVPAHPFSLLNPLWSTLFLDIPILAFVSRSRDRVENFLQHLCENDRSRYKGKKHILHLHLRSATLLLTKDDF